MLEAVNSVLSNASYTKVVADQTSVANSFAADPERVQQVSQQAPYLSLFIKMDVNFDKAILQMRDNQSGDVLRQIPSESQLEAYRRAQSSNAVRPATAEEELAVVTEPKTTQAVDATGKPAQNTVSAATSTPAPKAPVSVDTQA